MSNPKTYSTKESDYCPGETEYRVSTKTSVVNALKKYSDAVLYAEAESYSPSAKLGPQGMAKAEKYPMDVSAEHIANEAESWAGKVAAYVTSVRSDGTQKVVVTLRGASQYRYSFIVNADTVQWEC